MSKTVSVLVTATIPQGCDADDVVDYVSEAVHAWCKTLEQAGTPSDNPGDPRFFIDEHILSVDRVEVEVREPA